MLHIHFGDNLEVLRSLPDAAFALIYIDPPFNTGKVQARTRLKTVRDDAGDRTGFQGQRYRSIKLGEQSYADIFSDYLAFLEPRLMEAHRLLTPDGSLFFHIDYREVHYCKVLLDQIFGRESFINEIIWAYDYGARATRRWSPKHDNILWYAKNPDREVSKEDAAACVKLLQGGAKKPAKAMPDGEFAKLCFPGTAAQVQLRCCPT